MVAPKFPWPSNSGGTVRVTRLLQGLAKHAEITFVAPCRAKENLFGDISPGIGVEVVPVSEHAPTWRRWYGLISPRPYHHELYMSWRTQHVVARLLNERRYDLVYCHFLYSLQYIPNDCTIPIVVDPQNVDRQYWSRRVQNARGLRWLVTKLNLAKVKRYEGAQLKRVQAYILVSEDDRYLTRQFAEPAVKHFFVAPNGVSLEIVKPIDWVMRGKGDTVTLGFMGSLDLDFNSKAAQYLCLELLPALHIALPKILFKVLLIGRNPPERLLKLSNSDPSVVITGAVDDTVPWLHQCDIFVAPLWDGAGTKLKVLEAMGCGLPVVGTNIALQGIHGEVGVHYEYASDTDDFVRIISRLSLAPEERIRLGIHARKLVEERFDFDKIVGGLYEELKEMLNNENPRKW